MAEIHILVDQNEVSPLKKTYCENRKVKLKLEIFHFKIII